MIPQLLRGKAIYVGLALLSVFLVLWAARTGSLMGDHIPTPPSVQGIDLSWPEPMDANTMKDYLLHRPLLAMMWGISMVVLAGLSLSGFALTLWFCKTGQIFRIWRVPMHPPPRWSFGEIARIALLAVFAAVWLPALRVSLLVMWPSSKLDLNLWIVISMLFLDLWVVAMILVFAEGKRGSRWETLGLSRAHLRSSLTEGFRSYVTVFPWLLLLLFLVTELARLFGFQPPLEPIHQLIFHEQRTLVLGLTMVLACLVGPAAEEMFFRGVVYAVIRRYASRGLGIFVSGCLFALIHTNVLGFLPIMALGCLLAYLYERTGSLISPIAVHIFHNAVLMGVSMVFRGLVK